MIDVLRVNHPHGLNAVERLRKAREYKNEWCGKHEGVSIDELRCVQCLKAWVGGLMAKSEMYEALLAALAIEDASEGAMLVPNNELTRKILSFSVRPSDEGVWVEAEEFYEYDEPEKESEMSDEKIEVPVDDRCIICGEQREENLVGTCRACTDRIKAENEERYGTAENCKLCGKGEACSLEPQELHAAVVVHGRRIGSLEIEVRELKDLLRRVVELRGPESAEESHDEFSNEDKAPQSYGAEEGEA